jgi:hypothetical protein
METRPINSLQPSLAHPTIQHRQGLNQGINIAKGLVDRKIMDKSPTGLVSILS